MRLVFTILSLLLAGNLLTAQPDPVHWSASVKKTGADTYELTFKASIDEGWTVYSQNIQGDGPVPTSFTFDPLPSYALDGKAAESGNRKEIFDKVFGIKLAKFYKDAVFTQKIKASDASKPVKGYLTFMTCNNEMCLPPKDVNFSFNLQSLGAAIGDAAAAGTPAAAPPGTGDQIAGEIKLADMGDLKPTEWTAFARKTAEGEYDLVFTVKILKGWYVYSQKQDSDDGPLPTEFTFEDDGNTSRDGDVKESDNRLEVFDKVFGMKVRKFKETATFTQHIKIKDLSKPVKGYVSFQTCDDSKCIKGDFDFVFNLGGQSTAATTNDPNMQGTFDSKRDIDASKPVVDCAVKEDTSSGSLLWIFVIGFLGGLVALLTPCVFPMIPLTVSFFTKSSKDRATGIRNAITYGLSIIFIYVAIGIVLTSIFGPTILNEMSTDMYFNMLFFIVFIIFAFSFFGYYEITLPSSWANKSDQAADRGGLIGIFFMAFTLSLVSFSCTGPIIGTLLVQTVQNAEDFLFGFIPIKPLVGMFGFSFALALPFGLFAAFPSWLSSLPKSGSWMTNVKVTLGFLELALALKFFSTADMVRHWELLKYELFIGLWILVFAGLALYQFGFIRFPHDSPLKKLTAGRWITGLTSLAFVFYLCTGFTYHPLSILSGLAPPVHYSWWGPKGCPHGLECYHDFDEAVQRARELNKPVFVDFTGYGCVNCRKMEENVWVKPEILQHLKNDYVVVSLYVDDQERLFGDDKQKYLLDKHTNQRLRTKGSKWASFQINNFGTSSQPYYVLMHHDGKTVLNQPVGYTPDVALYREFLNCGINAFRQLSGK